MPYLAASTNTVGAITLSSLLIALIGGTILPLLTDLVTKAHASDLTKSVVNFVLAGFWAFLAAHATPEGTSSFTAHMALEWAVTELSATVALIRGWKPATKLIAKASDPSVATPAGLIAPNFGIGGAK